MAAGENTSSQQRRFASRNACAWSGECSPFQGAGDGCLDLGRAVGHQKHSAVAAEPLTPGEDASNLGRNEAETAKTRLNGAEIAAEWSLLKQNLGGQTDDTRGVDRLDLALGSQLSRH